MFSKKATKFDKIFTVDLTLCSKCQIDGEDFVNFCGLLRKHELYLRAVFQFNVSSVVCKIFSVKDLKIFCDLKSECSFRIFFIPVCLALVLLKILRGVVFPVNVFTRI